jgi:hypothetical protein
MNTEKSIAAVMIISLVLIAGCISGGPKDCGSDESCFAESVQSCSPATIETVEKDEVFEDLKVGYKISASVIGDDGGSCVVEEKFKEIEMTGNLTGAPARLIYLLYAMTDSPIRCSVSGPIELDMQGIHQLGAQCSGDMVGLLDEALIYLEGGQPNTTANRIEVLENFCPGGKKVIVYIRNIGGETINISTGLELLNATSGEGISVEWFDFTGAQALSEIYPGSMAQFSLESEPGTLHSYELVLDSESYPFSVQC